MSSCSSSSFWCLHLNSMCSRTLSCSELQHFQIKLAGSTFFLPPSRNFNYCRQLRANLCRQASATFSSAFPKDQWSLVELHESHIWLQILWAQLTFSHQQQGTKLRSTTSCTDVSASCRQNVQFGRSSGTNKYDWAVILLLIRALIKLISFFNT